MDNRLKRRKEECKNDLDYFSNKGKPDRERWVVKEFLSLLGVDVLESLLKSPPQESKIDVIYGELNFQVKEITDPNVQINSIVHSNYNVAKNATNFEDSFPEPFSNDIPAISKAYDLIKEQSIKLSDSGKYTDEDKVNLDLIFHITRSRVGKVLLCDINESDFIDLGWRSVTCLMGNKATVIFANYNAPKILKSAFGGI